MLDAWEEDELASLRRQVREQQQTIQVQANRINKLSGESENTSICYSVSSGITDEASESTVTSSLDYEESLPVDFDFLPEDQDFGIVGDMTDISTLEIPKLDEWNDEDKAVLREAEYHNGCLFIESMPPSVIADMAGAELPDRKMIICLIYQLGLFARGEGAYSNINVLYTAVPSKYKQICFFPNLQLMWKYVLNQPKYMHFEVHRKDVHLNKAGCFTSTVNKIVSEVFQDCLASDVIDNKPFVYRIGSVSSFIPVSCSREEVLALKLKKHRITEKKMCTVPTDIAELLTEPRKRKQNKNLNTPWRKRRVLGDVVAGSSAPSFLGPFASILDYVLPFLPIALLLVSLITMYCN